MQPCFHSLGINNFYTELKLLFSNLYLFYVYGVACMCTCTPVCLDLLGLELEMIVSAVLVLESFLRPLQEPQ